MIEVINDKCVGCGACLKACAYDAIRVTDKLASIDLEKCTLSAEPASRLAPSTPS